MKNGYGGRGRSADPGLIMGHLMGRYSLARSYWVHTVLLGWLLTACVGMLVRWLDETYPLRYVSMVVVAYVPLALSVWTWSTFGTIVSALRRLFGGGGAFWSLVALLILSLSAVAVVGGLPGMKAAIREHWAVVGGYQPGDAFTISATPDGLALLYEGGVQEGAARALERALLDAPQARTLVLTSSGGWLKEGQAMAAVVRRFNLNTAAREQCASACTVVLLAGVNRTAEPGARIGFHRGRSIGESAHDRAPPSSEDEAAIYLQAGLSRDFVGRIMRTPNHAIWEPTRRELLRAGVLTR